MQGMLIRRADSNAIAQKWDAGLDRLASRSRIENRTAVLVIVAVLYLWFRCGVVAATGARFTPDTWEYFALGNLNPLSPDFWTSGRAPGYALLIKAVWHNHTALIYAQAMISAACWGFLAITLARLLPSIAGLAAGVVLAFSLTPQLAGWDSLMLTESLHFAFFALWLSLLIRLAHAYTWRLAAAFLAVSATWVMVRDATVLVLAMTSFAWAVYSVWIRRPKRLVVSLGLLLMAGTSAKLADYAPRWVNTVSNVIAVRVIPDPTTRRFFEARGLVVTPELLAASGHTPTVQDWKRLDKTGFREWVVSRGKTTLLSYLLTHPSYALTAPAWEHILSPHLAHYANTSPLPDWMQNTLWPWRMPETLVWLALTLPLVAWLRPRGALAGVAYALVLTAYPISLAGWHADAMEMPRHALQGIFQFRLGIILLIVAGIDTYSYRAARAATLAPVNSSL